MRGTVFGPAPQSLATGSGASHACTRSGTTTVRPSGLSWALATLATCLVDDTPTEMVSPVARRTASLTRRPIVAGGPNSRSAPDMSRKASSRESASTFGEKSMKTRMTRSEIST